MSSHIPSLAAAVLAAAFSIQSADVIRVPLARNEKVSASMGWGVSFDRATVEAAVAKAPLRLPDPLPNGSSLGVVDDVFVLLTRMDNEAGVRVTVDLNVNRDLTDDGPIEFAGGSSPAARPVVRIKRMYQGSATREAWLPYQISYSSRKNSKGEVQEAVTFYPVYRMDGSFIADGRGYGIELSDYAGRGVFDKRNLTQGTVLRLFPQDDPDNGARFWGHELLPLGEALYEVRDEAIDGSWIELAKSSLPKLMLGRPTPDFDFTDAEGKRISRADYKGRYLLLDFWPSWCQPCVAEFANIKARVAKHAGGRLSIVSINLDSEKGLESARKIIASKDLTWPQVLPGKGYFLPLYQALGRLPEEPGAFPLYVVIGPDGTLMYASNHFSRVERLLDVVLQPGGPNGNSLFVPLTSRLLVLGGHHPVDFTSSAAAALRNDKRLSLPPDASVGLLPNGAIVISRPGRTADSLLVRVLGNRDLNVAAAAEKEVPVLTAPPSAFKAATSFAPVVAYSTGAESMLPFAIFALARAASPPQMFYWGYSRPSSGSFFAGKAEYRIEIADASDDIHYSDADATAPGFLKVSMKKGATWVPVHSGSTNIPIAGKLYRVRHVHDDGGTIELEEQEGRSQG